MKFGTSSTYRWNTNVFVLCSTGLGAYLLVFTALNCSQEDFCTWSLKKVSLLISRGELGQLESQAPKECKRKVKPALLVLPSNFQVSLNQKDAPSWKLVVYSSAVIAGIMLVTSPRTAAGDGNASSSSLCFWHAGPVTEQSLLSPFLGIKLLYKVLLSIPKKKRKRS